MYRVKIKSLKKIIVLKVMDYNVLPDEKLMQLLEKYTEKNERYKFFVNEETERSEQNLIEINNELKRREEFRNSMSKTKKPKPNLVETNFENDLKV
jgi:hypothetical protein